MTVESEPMTLVIGAGPDGLRAAATLAASGRAVHLLQGAETASGRTHPDIPEGVGTIATDAVDASIIETVLGSFAPEAAPQRVVGMNGSLHPLPLGLGGVAALFASDHLPDVVHRFVRRRLRNSALPLTGGGQEERSYRDWVVRRLGEPIYRHLYADYAARRWGADGERLSASVARIHHGGEEPDRRMRLARGHAAGFEQAVALIEANGGTVQTRANVRGLKVEDGRVTGVRVGRRLLRTDQPVWIARSPATIASWIGPTLDESLQVDAVRLGTQDAVLVAFPHRGLVADEIHLMDGSAPWYRLVKLNEDTVVFHVTTPTGTVFGEREVAACVETAARLGVNGLDASAARVERLVEWVPVWTKICHARLRRLALAWQDLGVIAVGRTGTFTPMDPGTEVGLAHRYANEDVPDQREGLRALLEPPVRTDDLDLSPGLILSA